MYCLLRRSASDLTKSHEWAWLLIFSYIRAIYLLHGFLGVAGAVVLGAVPIVNIGVAIWSLFAMHEVYGCRTVAIAFAVWMGVTLVGIVLIAVLG